MTRYPDLPATMRALPVDHRGIIVPWFVAWRDGAPFFPALDPDKLQLAWHERLCWTCGQPLRQVMAFVIGPMCAVNRISSEPPSHPECARFAARHCPFLTRPNMARVPVAKYPGGERGDAAGLMIERNPGVALLWFTLRAGLVGDGRGGRLFHLGNPRRVEWYREGRPATREEVQEAIATGIPLLAEACELDADPAESRAALRGQLATVMSLLPAR
jgi:hypothetical protein